MMTNNPTNLKLLFALFLPNNVNRIELAAEATVIKEIDSVFLRNVGKYWKNICTLPAYVAEPFEENVPIHNIKIHRGMSKSISPTIINQLLCGAL